MAISDAARRNHDELFPEDRTSTLAQTDSHHPRPTPYRKD